MNRNLTRTQNDLFLLSPCVLNMHAAGWVQGSLRRIKPARNVLRTFLVLLPKQNFVCHLILSCVSPHVRFHEEGRPKQQRTRDSSKENHCKKQQARKDIPHEDLRDQCSEQAGGGRRGSYLTTLCFLSHPGKTKLGKTAPYKRHHQCKIPSPARKERPPPECICFPPHGGTREKSDHSLYQDAGDVDGLTQD